MKLTSLLFLTSLLLLTGCYRLAQNVCNVAILPYTLTVAVNSNTGKNAEYIKFRNDKRSCEDEQRDKIIAFYKQMEREKPYKTLKIDYVDTKLAPKDQIRLALNSAISPNATGPNGWLKERVKRVEYNRDGITYKYSDLLEMFEKAEKAGWSKKYTQQYKSILKQCLSKKYSSEEISRLDELEFNQMWMPKTACVVF